MKYLVSIMSLLLVCASVQATTVIAKSADTSANSVYNYISVNSFYQNLTDDFLVIDMNNGAAEKFHVTHQYNGETYTTIVPLNTANSEASAAANFANAMKDFWNKDASFYSVPQSAVSSVIDLAKYSFVRNDLRDHISSKLSNSILTVIDQTLVRAVGYANVSITDHRTFYTSDRGRVTVELVYTRSMIKVIVLEIRDKYNNTISMDSQDLKHNDYRVNFDDSDYINALHAFLKSAGANPLWTPQISYGGSGSSGRVIIIDCNGSGCSIQRE